MKLAIVGSRGIIVNDLEKYVPHDVTEIVSGGAAGVDTCAHKYALEKGIKLTEFLPDYEKFGKRAPLQRNLQIIEYADYIMIFWDGKSSGSRHVMQNCRRMNKKFTVYARTVEKPEENTDI